MRKSIKIIVRNYNTKKGTTFTKLSVGGKYLPLAVAEDEVNYQVRFTKDSVAKEPTNNGIYEVAFEEGNLWIDNRNETPVVRVRAVKVIFDKPLIDKDIRLK